MNSERRAVSKAKLTASDLIIVGYPKRKVLLGRMPDQAVIHAKTFTLNNSMYNEDSAVFFGVFGHPYAGNRVAALFWPPASRYAEMVARKITHYGKYSYLAFQEGKNKDKGFWQISESPLVYQWSKDWGKSGKNFKLFDNHQ
jgi:hypothetical protein